MPKQALVVIPATGSPTFESALKSAVSQTYQSTDVWVIIDGPQFHDRTMAAISRVGPVRTMTLPENTGANGFYGHRIYAAVSFLFDHDYVLYLDQDNMYQPNHVETMVSAIEGNGWHWCHSLRSIHDVDGAFICHDDCESLGRWPIFLGDKQHLVDTSTYCIKREVIVQIASAWYSGWGGDRRFYAAMSHHFPNFGCTGQSTVCYRLDGNPGSVNADFFMHGNNIMRSRYPTGFPWRTT